MVNSVSSFILKVLVPYFKTKFSRLIWLTVCSCHVTYAFQSGSTLFSCLNVKELLAGSRCEIWSLSDCNWLEPRITLVCKPTLNHLAKLAIWRNGWVVVYELSGSRFESSCSHLNLVNYYTSINKNNFAGQSMMLYKIFLNCTDA